MSDWLYYHCKSEEFISMAETTQEIKFLSIRKFDWFRTFLYTKAAKAEERAFSVLPPEQSRTKGITAISAVCLWIKANNHKKAKQLATVYRELGLPEFAIKELELILEQQ